MKLAIKTPFILAGLLAGHASAEPIGINFGSGRANAELLPTDWPGREAAERFATLRASLLDDAAEWWTSTEASFSPSIGSATA